MTQLSFWGYDENGVASRRGRRLVYFLACSKFVKIGFTKRDDISERVGELGTGNPEPLDLLGSLFVSSEQDDRDLHKRFAKFHYRNEWFHKTPELLQAINQLLQQHEIVTGRFAPDELQRPVYIRHYCLACNDIPQSPFQFPRGAIVRLSFQKPPGNAEWRIWRVEITGDDVPGAILGGTACDRCAAPFVVRIRSDSEQRIIDQTTQGVHFYRDGSVKLKGDWTNPDPLAIALLSLCDL